MLGGTGSPRHIVKNIGQISADGKQIEALTKIDKAVPQVLLHRLVGEYSIQQSLIYEPKGMT
jgi:hypothetical protein